MVSIGDLGIDRTAEPKQFDSEPLPRGKYPGQITKAEVKEASTGAQCLALEATFDGGRKAWTTLTLIKSTGEQNMPGIGQLSALSLACGLLEIPADESRLLNIPIIIKLDIEEAKGGYAAKNVMKAFYPVEKAETRHIGAKIRAATVVEPSEDTSELPF